MKLRWLEPVAFPAAVAAVRVLAATWRFRVRGGENLRAARGSGRPVLFALWHSRILPLLFYHRHEGVVTLISRHRDGEYLARLADRWGYGAVRGSSGRGGDIGLLGLVRALETAGQAAITPDGPRGPAERVKPGAVAAAQQAGALLVPVTAQPDRAWWFTSWDRFCLPKVLARIEITYAAPFSIEPGKAALRDGVERLERELRQLGHDA